MRNFFLLLTALVFCLPLRPEEAPQTQGDESKSAEAQAEAQKEEEEQPAAVQGIPLARVLDADKDGKVTPAEKGAYVKAAAAQCREEAIKRFDMLHPRLKNETTPAEQFTIPEIEQYRSLVRGLKQRAEILREVYSQIRSLDVNRDDVLSGDEFIYAARLLEIIKPLTFPPDRNGNGYISPSELAFVEPKNIVLPGIKLFTARKWKAPDGYVIPKDAIILAYDADGDGRLNISELNDLAWAVVAAANIYAEEAAASEEILRLFEARYEEIAAELRERE